MAARPAVSVKGLDEFRRDLRRQSKETARELQKELRAAARIVAAEADVVRGSRRSFSYKGGARGVRAYVGARGPKDYVARFIEFGFHPGGGTTFVEGRNIVGQAIERKEDEVVERIGDAVERAATHVGWK